jgi:hypothetical protein
MHSCMPATTLQCNLLSYIASVSLLIEQGASPLRIIQVQFTRNTQQKAHLVLMTRAFPPHAQTRPGHSKVRSR